MKKIAILTLLVFSASIVALKAQGPQPGERPSIEDMVERTVTDLAKEMTLTDKEQTSIKEIFTSFFTEMDELHESNEKPDMTKFKELEGKRDEKIKALLSEDNYKSYLKVMESQKRPPHGDTPPPSRE